MSTKRSILLLAGKVCSGKDFTADILVKKGWLKLSLADHLKKITSIKFDIPLDSLYTQEGKRKLYDSTRTYRDLLMDTADIYKKNNRDFFVDSLIERIKVSGLEKNIVIPDFRYENEFSIIKKRLSDDFIIRSSLVFRNRGVDIDHPSEKSLKGFPFDFVIYNNSTEEHVVNQLDFHLQQT